MPRICYIYKLLSGRLENIQNRANLHRCDYRKMEARLYQSWSNVALQSAKWEKILCVAENPKLSKIIKWRWSKPVSLRSSVRILSSQKHRKRCHHWSVHVGKLRKKMGAMPDWCYSVRGTLVVLATFMNRASVTQSLARQRYPFSTQSLESLQRKVR